MTIDPADRPLDDPDDDWLANVADRRLGCALVVVCLAIAVLAVIGAVSLL